MPEPSPALGLVWQVASFEASEAALTVIEPEQFLIALCKTDEMLNTEIIQEAKQRNIDLNELRAELYFVPEVLRSFGVDPVKLRRELRSKSTRRIAVKPSKEPLHQSERSRRAFAQAEELAENDGSPHTRTSHLFLALLEECDSPACAILEKMGAPHKDVYSKASKMAGRFVTTPLGRAGGAAEKSDKGTPFLNRFGRDLTELAFEDKIGPIIGRRKELLQVIQTLMRRTKNNPVLVGEAGVGKTAICEALAIRISQGKDAHILGGKRIVELNMGTLVGGTKFRGEFEERLKKIVEEVQSHPEVILFIDEIHTVVGAGKSEGGLDAANLLKPSLARGELRCIGATTLAEYRRFIESDSALERRFEKIQVNEPTRDNTVEILKGLKARWEEHHQVRIADAAIIAAVDLAIRFDPEHQLPDKAIDIIDKACARVRIPRLSLKPEMFESSGGRGPVWGEVTENTVSEVVTEKTEIPFEIVQGHFAAAGGTRFLDMEATLKKRVVGQDEAIEKLSKKLLLAYTGLLEKRGPIGVFLFLGPSGVGKTELSLVLAGFLFGNEKDLIRLDMSEYTEDHTIAKLIGSPPGYVGYEEEGQLTGKIRTKPYSVVLLDDVEKASPKVLNLFLQLFDEGRLTDSKGRTVDARNVVFILTSNFQPDKKMGFRTGEAESTETAVLKEVKKRLSSEVLSRIDEILVFNSLSLADIKLILESRRIEIQQSLRDKHHIDLELTAKAKDFIAQRAFNEETGARELNRVLERLIKVPLGELIAAGRLKPNATLIAETHGKELRIVPKPEKKR